MRKEWMALGLIWLTMLSVSLAPLTIIATVIFLIKRDPVWKKWLLAAIASSVFLIALIMAMPLPE